VDIHDVTLDVVSVEIARIFSGPDIDNLELFRTVRR